MKIENTTNENSRLTIENVYQHIYKNVGVHQVTEINDVILIF